MFVRHKTYILDGGLATELERRGHDLNHALWSARLIRENPTVIKSVHRAYLEAGAEVIIAATYQVSQDAQMVADGVRLAVEARDGYGRGIVAASIGPYGAYLANGAEYTGDYDLNEGQLVDFHALRWDVCMRSSADLLACETIPSLPETRALLTLLHRQAQNPVWFAFSCRNGRQINDGTPLHSCAELLADEPRVAAIGVNCTRPVYIEEAIAEIRAVSDKPIVVYPNSGERWDAANHCWIDGSAETVEEYVARAMRWRSAGATIIGGCCRTTPVHIAALKRAFLLTSSNGR